MGELAAVLLITLLVVFVLVPLLAVLLGARALRRRNRVSPDVPSPAPVAWLGAPTTAARLHRRLRDAVTVARTAATMAPDAPRLAEITAELEQEAAAVDGHLVMVARMPTAQRRAHLAALRQQVLRLEQVASKVSLHAAQARAPMVAEGQPSPMEQLSRELDAVEEARAEISRIERDAGVRRVSPYAEGTPSSGTAGG